MGSLPLIGIMVPYRKQRRKNIRLYTRYKGSLMIELFCFTPKDINWAEREIKGFSFKNNNKWETRSFPFPDAVYNRCYRKNAKIVRRLEKYIGENKCFNHVTYFSKWRIYNILSPTELDKYLPETWIYKPGSFMEELKKEKRLILKPSYGCLGKNIYLVELTEDQRINIYQDTLVPMYTFNDEKALMEKLAGLMGKKKYITQKLIQMAKVSGKITDIRILVQKDINGSWSVTNAISRAAPYNFFITNCCERIYQMEEALEGIISDPLKRDAVSREIYEISKKIAQNLEEKMGHLGEIGIDMAIDIKGHIWILEVNGKTQKHIYQMIDSFDGYEDRNNDRNLALVYQRPLEYAYYLSQEA